MASREQEKRMNTLSDLQSLSWGAWLYTIAAAGVSAAATAITANPIASVLGAQQFTPRQLGIMALSAAVVAIAGVLRKSPLPDRTVAIALQPGVHTQAQVDQVMKATAPGTVPTPEVTAAILGNGLPPAAASAKRASIVKAAKA
jgi:hypothetical protein